LNEAVRDAEVPKDAEPRPVVVFLSYRRGDTQWAARGIYDRLTDRYGHKSVFRDLDAIPPGVRFREYVEKKISESDVLLLLIGNAWASYADEMGRRRLEQPRDPVRLEIETALRLGVPIIPVRVEGAPMPTERDLVPSIMDLLEFNAAEVTDSRWNYDVDRLLRAINETVERSLDPSAPKSARDRAAEEQARREAEEQSRREAEEQSRREAEEQALRENEQRTRRENEQRTRREAEERARRENEQRTRREKEEQTRRDAAEQAQPLSLGREPTAVIELSPLEAPERTRSWTTARNLLRHRAVVSAAAGIGGVVVLVIYLMSASSGEKTIMGHLPEDLRTSCTAGTDNAATCQLSDRTVVLFRLFDTAAEANAAVVGGRPMAPAGDPCPPAPGAATGDQSGGTLSVNEPVVCRYAVGPEKGTALFSHTEKDTIHSYLTRWVADAEPLLRGEMATHTANPADWTTLTTNWTQLAGKP
jgi:hypothetical protein